MKGERYCHGYISAGWIGLFLTCVDWEIRWAMVELEGRASRSMICLMRPLEVLFGRIDTRHGG